MADRKNLSQHEERESIKPFLQKKCCTIIGLRWSVKIDSTLLLLQWVGVCMTTALLCALYTDKREE